jgi:hypothetical protein
MPRTVSGYISSYGDDICCLVLPSGDDESGDARYPVLPKDALLLNMFDLGLSPVEIEDPDTKEGVLAGSKTGVVVF